MQIHHITFEPVFTGFMGKWLVLNGKKHWGCLFQGGGSALGPQLIAELGDVTRFSHRDAITAFAGVDPGANQSRTYE
jgi:hypothetical protein